MKWNGTLTIQEVAEFMGKSVYFVRRSIENGSLPIGCYTREGEKAGYYISPKRAYEWLGYEREEITCDADGNCDDS